MGSPSNPSAPARPVKGALLRRLLYAARPASGPNCGDGSGGFKAGNKCQRKGSGATAATGPAPAGVRPAPPPAGPRTPGRPAAAAGTSSLAEKVRARQSRPVHPTAPGAAPMPPGAAVTAADRAAAAHAPAIPHPTSDADVSRFVSAVEQTPTYRAVAAKMAALAADSPGNNNTLWSLGKHATGDVLAALREGGHEAYEHIRWTPERKALHEKILAGMLNPEARAKPGETPKVVFLVGPPGSGKTMAGQPEADKLGVKFTTVNADDVKGKLPEYEGWNAGAVHEESALVSEGPLTNRAMDARHHILMDLTGGNQAKLAKMAEGMHRLGYEVHLVSIALPAYKSTGRAWDRFAKNAFGHADPTGKTRELGRYVPPGYVHESIDGKPERTYQHLKAQPYVKSHVSISTDVPKGEPPRVVDRGGNP